MSRLMKYPLKSVDSLSMYDTLKNFSWLDSFLRLRDLQDRLKELEVEKQTIIGRPSCKADVQKRFEKSLSKYQTKRIDFLWRFISEFWEDDDPFVRFHGRCDNPYTPIPFSRAVNLPELQEAFKDYPEAANSISETERSKELAKIEKELKALRADVVKLSPEKFRVKDKQGITRDAREVLVKEWYFTQRDCVDEVNVFGRRLFDCPVAEQKAHKKLNLPVNPYGAYVGA